MGHRHTSRVVPIGAAERPMQSALDRRVHGRSGAEPEYLGAVPLATSSMPTRSRRSAGQVVRAYVALTKPRIIELLLVTTLPTMFLAAQGLPPLGLTVATLIGGALAAGGANALNCYLDRDIDQYTREMEQQSQQSEVCRRLQTIPGYGPIVGGVFHSTVGNGEAYRRGRDVSASLGLVPRQHSSGGKEVWLDDERLHAMIKFNQTLINSGNYVTR